MEYSKTVQNKTSLTELEIRVLNASRVSDFGDALDQYGTWSFSVADAAGLEERIYRGVVASLIKKGLVVIQDQEGKGKYKDMALMLTEDGKARFI